MKKLKIIYALHLLLIAGNSTQLRALNSLKNLIGTGTDAEYVRMVNLLKKNPELLGIISTACSKDKNQGPTKYRKLFTDTINHLGDVASQKLRTRRKFDSWCTTPREDLVSKVENSVAVCGMPPERLKQFKVAKEWLAQSPEYFKQVIRAAAKINNGSLVETPEYIDAFVKAAKLTNGRLLTRKHAFGSHAAKVIEENIKQNTPIIDSFREHQKKAQTAYDNATQKMNKMLKRKASQLTTFYSRDKDAIKRRKLSSSESAYNADQKKLEEQKNRQLKELKDRYSKQLEALRRAHEIGIGLILENNPDYNQRVTEVKKRSLSLNSTRSPRRRRPQKARKVGGRRVKEPRNKPSLLASSIKFSSKAKNCHRKTPSQGSKNQSRRRSSQTGGAENFNTAASNLLRQQQLKAARQQVNSW